MAELHHQSTPRIEHPSYTSSAEDDCACSFHKGESERETVTLATMAESDCEMLSSSVTFDCCDNDHRMDQQRCSVDAADLVDAVEHDDADAVSSFSDCDGSVCDDYFVRGDGVATNSPAEHLVNGRARLCMRIPSSVHLPSCLEDDNCNEEADDERSVPSSVSGHEEVGEQSSDPPLVTVLDSDQDAGNSDKTPGPDSEQVPKEKQKHLSAVPPSSKQSGTQSPHSRDFSYSPTTLGPSSTLPLPQRSLVKMNSSISIDTSIPLNFHRRGSVKVLPKPDPALLELAQLPIRTAQQHRQLLRSSCSYGSLPNYDHLCPTSESSPTLNRQVSFSKIQVREHKRTIGDNPSCAYGTPISLDWECLQWDDVSLDEYEARRYSNVAGRGTRVALGRPRKLRELHLNHYQRRDILQLEGYTLEEIKAQKRITDKVRKQREMTRLVAQTCVLLKIEDMVESAGRKVQRVLNKKDCTDRSSSSSSSSTQQRQRRCGKQSHSKEWLLRCMDADVSHNTVSTTATTDSIAI